MITKDIIELDKDFLMNYFIQNVTYGVEIQPFNVHQ